MRELKYLKAITRELKQLNHNLKVVLNIMDEGVLSKMSELKYLKDIVMELKNLNHNLKAILKNMEAEREDKLKEKHEHSEDQIS